MGKVVGSSTNSLPGEAWIIYKSPGIGGSGRDDISVSVCRGYGKWTIGADGFVNGLDEWFWIYLYTYLKSLSRTIIPNDSRFRSHCIDYCLWNISEIDKLLANGRLSSGLGRFTGDIVVWSDYPGIGSSSRNDI